MHKIMKLGKSGIREAHTKGPHTAQSVTQSTTRNKANTTTTNTPQATRRTPQLLRVSRVDERRCVLGFGLVCDVGFAAGLLVNRTTQTRSPITLETRNV